MSARMHIASKLSHHGHVFLVQVILLHEDQFEESVKCVHLRSNGFAIIQELPIPRAHPDANEVIKVAISHHVCQVGID